MQGSKDKLLVMAERAASGLPLFVSGDSRRRVDPPDRREEPKFMNTHKYSDVVRGMAEDSPQFLSTGGMDFAAQSFSDQAKQEVRECELHKSPVPEKGKVK